MKSQALWTGLGLIGALRARISGGLPRDASGVSIDTRTLTPGDLFFAIKGEARDGHEFVRAALERGASGAVVDDAHAGEFKDIAPLYVVRDVQESLEWLGARARERSSAYVAAITGSVGKTSTKEMARTMLSSFGETHASAASYNNQWGVPLSLARMAASARFGVFEIGMNHAGEIASLAPFVAPHVAVVTRVAPVHLEHFDSLEAIAAAKAEIFSGLIEGGVAVINRDDETYDALLEGAAASRAAHVFSFGESEGAQARLLSYDAEEHVAEAEIFGRRLRYSIGAPGRHFAVNSLAVLTIAHIFGIDIEQAAETLAGFEPPEGRGRRETFSLRGGSFTLIDESYNANPTSMRAAFDLLGAEKATRRVAVLGDMLELGPSAGELHAGLARDLEAAGVDLVFTAGPLMARLFYAAPEPMRGVHRANARELEEAVLAAVAPDDAIMVKGSNGSRMAGVVEAIRRTFTAVPGDAVP
ncbi:UDP-N-acetylmuramoylalanyl-D-glutamyl-2,6-diaminopimelate--D-alanyl-D-alanine ligase [Methylosinus sp. Ce-a6]|uniref:UDP-N-acetylmuramoylalanyl-D-glutamyl-2, 6-diaminopimelate--D-alanyl-D-alanine ligase n=1 Tax=Methylosinus sp. Ce-a6 TaxID=2172005 RepID=UPI0013597C3D|nr:UDP-N-acetylmuramoylalanyl-D-glutamyl-2,6-diaminopimelate--D-alanyl-D-alanine ligase [Methylosinus sp. Ce-a6]